MELAELVDEAGKIIGLAKYLGTESTVLSSSDFAKFASESVSIEYMSLSFISGDSDLAELRGRAPCQRYTVQRSDMARRRSDPPCQMTTQSKKYEVKCRWHKPPS